MSEECKTCHGTGMLEWLGVNSCEQEQSPRVVYRLCECVRGIQRKYFEEFGDIRACPAWEYVHEGKSGGGFTAWVKDGCPGYPHYFKRRKPVQDYEDPIPTTIIESLGSMPEFPILLRKFLQ